LPSFFIVALFAQYSDFQPLHNGVCRNGVCCPIMIVMTHLSPVCSFLKRKFWVLVIFASLYYTIINTSRKIIGFYLIFSYPNLLSLRSVFSHDATWRRCNVCIYP